MKKSIFWSKQTRIYVDVFTSSKKYVTFPIFCNFNLFKEFSSTVLLSTTLWCSFLKKNQFYHKGFKRYKYIKNSYLMIKFWGIFTNFNIAGYFLQQMYKMWQNQFYGLKNANVPQRVRVQKNMWFFYFYIKDFTLTVLLSTSFYAVFWKKINFNLKGSNDTGI